MNFNSETIGNKNSSAHEILSEKYATFVTFHGQKWRQGFWLVQEFDVIFGRETFKGGIFFRSKFVSMNIDAGSNTSESWTKVHTLICDPL